MNRAQYDAAEQAWERAQERRPGGPDYEPPRERDDEDAERDYEDDRDAREAADLEAERILARDRAEAEREWRALPAAERYPDVDDGSPWR